MLRRLYDWVMHLAGSRHAALALAAVSFAESSFFPIPPDVMLAPMVLKRPDKAWSYALICTLASVLGGALGWAIGYHLSPIGTAVLKIFGHAEGLGVYRAWFAQNGFWLILLKGLTPVPFKLVTIASGLAGFSFWQFMLAATITRGGRFFLLAGAVKKFGPAMLPVIERRLALFTSGIVILALAGMALAHFLSSQGKGV